MLLPVLWKTIDSFKPLHLSQISLPKAQVIATVIHMFDFWAADIVADIRPADVGVLIIRENNLLIVRLKQQCRQQFRITDC